MESKHPNFALGAKKNFSAPPPLKILYTPLDGSYIFCLALLKSLIDIGKR